MKIIRAELVDESRELLVRVRGLEAFRGLDAWRALPRPEQDRMSLQLIFMRGYAAALSQRIEALDDAAAG